MKRLSYIPITVVGALLFAGPCATVGYAAAIRNLTGFTATTYLPNDDGTYPANGLGPGTPPGTPIAQPLGFTVNFYGLMFSTAFINNNGNITFDAPLATFTPFNLTSTNRQIIAPFFADVDTRFAGSTVMFGHDTVGGRNAFGVNWIDIDYFSSSASHVNRNSFQLVLIDRSDVGPGDFDIEFNYDQIRWETGTASGGNANGLGGSSARVGFSNGTGASETFFELPGSAIPGSLLDSNFNTGLIHGELGSAQPGRYVFQVRNGIVQPTLPVIFIPGAGGSTLVDGNGDVLWFGTPPFLVLNRRRLNLFTNGNPAPSQSVKPVDALRGVDCLGEHCAEQVYGPLLRFLTGPPPTGGGYREYQLSFDVNGDLLCDESQINPDPSQRPNLFVFPYDWRKEIALNANEGNNSLNSFVQCVEQFHPNQQVNILAHSMGGLVARRYILDHPDPHVSKLITIGTPWLGAPKLFYVLETGDFLSFANGVDMKYTMPSLPGAHELLPSRAYRELGGGRIFLEDGWDYDGNGVAQEFYDYDHVLTFLDTKYQMMPIVNWAFLSGITPTAAGTTADVFHSYSTLRGEQDNWMHDGTGVEYFHFYGVQRGNKTIQTILAKPVLICPGRGAPCTLQNRLVLEPAWATAGDGTVPARSAKRINNSGVNYNAPNAQLFRITDDHDKLIEHTDLTQHAEVKQRVISILSGTTNGSPPVPPRRVETRRAVELPSDDDDEHSSIPSYYLSIVGVTVIVSDNEGNSTAPIVGDLVGKVPGVETFQMAEHAEAVALPIPTTEEYSITFSVGDQAIDIKMMKGVDSMTPAEVIRYQDLVLPAGVAAQLKVTPQGVDNLRYDSDGDGTYDTVVQPTMTVTGPDALDITPPTIDFVEVQQGATTRLTIIAEDDPGSGIHDVNYSTDGTQFQEYTDPVNLDPIQTPIVYAFATDNVGNRSGRIAYTLTAPEATPTPTPAIAISGTISYCPNSSAVPNVTLILSGIGSGTTMSGPLGTYQFSPLVFGGTYAVTPSKAALLPTSAGIDTFDVMVTQRHYLTIAPIPPGCGRDAADVNGDNRIDTSDVVAIQRFFLGRPFGSANVGKYKFTPADRSYPGVVTDQTDQNYAALVYGDIAPGFVHRPDGESQTAAEVAGTVASVTLPEVAVDQSRSNFVSPVTTSEINAKNKLVGFQGDFTFDERAVTFQEPPVQNGGLTAGNWNVSGNVLPGPGPTRTLRISAFSNDFTPLSGKGTLFNLNMINVSKVAQRTKLIWAASPNQFVFIDADLNAQKPGNAAPGSVTTSGKGK